MGRIQRRISLHGACELVGGDRRSEQPEPADRDGAQCEAEPRPTQAQQQPRHANNERSGGRQYQRLREHAKFQPSHVDISSWLMTATSLPRHERRCRCSRESSHEKSRLGHRRMKTASVQEAQRSTPLTPEKQPILDGMRTYRESFTQNELDGITALYKLPAPG